MSGFLYDAWNAGKSNLYKALTGTAAPGTADRKQQDLQRRLQQTLLQSALDEANKTPNMTFQEQLGAMSQAGQLSQKLVKQAGLDNLEQAGGTSLLDVLGKKTRIADLSYGNRLSSETTALTDRLSAEADQKLRLMGGTPVELERYLADNDAALARDYMAYAAQSQERGIKAQQDGRVLPFIGGLLATAASLFA